MPSHIYFDFETSKSTKSTMPEDTALLLEYNKGDVVNLKAKRERPATQESANGGVNFR